MSLSHWMIDLLALPGPETQMVSIDDPGSVAIHRQIILSKPLMRRVYRDWYGRIANEIVNLPRNLEWPVFELGCGASHIEEYLPWVIKTDCVKHPFAERVVDAQDLPFADESVGAFVMTSMIHHLTDVEKFCHEINRCLRPGGRLVAVEPSRSKFAAWVTERFQKDETYDFDAKGWSNPQATRLTQANCALPWIVFCRDRERFERQFPKLKVVSVRRHGGLAYYLSGGLRFRSIVPDFLASSYFGLESAMEFVGRQVGVQFGTMMTVVVEKSR